MFFSSKKNSSVHFIRSFCITAFLFAANTDAFAQLAVNPNQTAAILSSTIGGPGITITSPVLTCAGQGNATFTVSPGTILGTGATVFGISNGIFLGTGKAINAPGNEATLASTNNGTAGDPALAALALTATLHDACILEFDFSAVGTSISFNYIFGSEEYNHSTCGPYNDAFAFFISGPGIAGTQNMALVPGTNIPVTVNSVNSGIPGAGYPLSNCTVMGPGSPFTTYFTDNTGGTRFTYKGFTTELAATHTVTPCSVYHLKISITDAGNTLYDSGVFIEAGSLSVPTIASGNTCVGGTTTFTAPIAGGTWTSGNISVATIGSATGIATGVATGTATITYGTGPTCYLTTTITVNALAPISGTTSICAGTTTTLTDPSGAGTWTSSNTTVATIGLGTGIVAGITGGTTTISFTTAAGCSAATVVTVTSVPPITGTTVLCIGGTSNLNDAAGSGTWSSSNPVVASISAAGVVNGLSSGTTTITYTIPGGCVATTVATVSAFFSSTVNAAICQGNSYAFAGATYTVTGTYTHTFSTATCDSVVTLHLTVNPASNTILYQSICSGTSYVFGGTSYTDSGTYTYPTTNIYGCDSIVTLHLSITPFPSAPSVVSPVTYCLAQSATQLVATGTYLTWYTTSTGGTGSSVAPVPSTASIGTTWYYVSQTAGDCEGPRDSIEVVVYPYPIAAITAIATTFCQYDTALFSTTAATSATYYWSAPGTDIVGSPTDPSVAMIFNTLGNHFVHLTATKNGQCTASDSIMVNVIPAPDVSFYVNPNVCFGDTIVVAISSTTPGVTNCTWDFGDADIISATSMVSGGPFNITWHTTGIHFIHMSAAIGECSSKLITDTVDVHVLPSAQFTNLSPIDICEGDSVLFSANEKNSNYYYHWSPDHFFHNLNDDNIWGIVERAGYVKLNVITEFGCRGEDSLLINTKACCELLLPNAFTPNGDGMNDIFRPITVGHHPIHTFMIVNRWGQTVYESTNERDGWNGSFNGVPQDMGVYFYYIKYDCNNKALEEKGELQLIR